MNGRVCAGIVTYNPDKNKLLSNINSVCGQVEKIVIIDNGSSNYLEWSSDIPREILIVQNDKNYGVAAALNQLCKYALLDGFDWCLTLDHDSVCLGDLVGNLMNNIEPDVAIIAPGILYKDNEKYNTKKEGIEQVDWVITSASLTNLKIWKELRFDETLFIDGVDRDYCIRANRKGYRVLKDNDVALEHELGNLKCKKLFGRIVHVTYHSNFRKYYMARNVIYLDRKLNEHNSMKKIMKLLFKTIFYEKSMKGINSIVRGIRDGRKMQLRMDK